jgi:hypothetical protein
MIVEDKEIILLKVSGQDKPGNCRFDFYIG